MNALWTIAVKDLKILFRDKAGLFWVLGFPVLMAILFGSIFGGTGGSGASKMKIAVIDNDQTDTSKAFVAKLKESTALDIQATIKDPKDEIRRGKLVAMVVVPKGYGSTSMFSGQQPEIEMAIDPARKAEAGMLQGLLAEASFAPMQETFSNPAAAKTEMAKAQQQAKTADMTPNERTNLTTFLDAASKYFDTMPPAGTTAAGGFSGPKIKQVPVANEKIGPKSAYEVTFPQGIIWGLISVAATFSLALVRERIGGTFLRLKVSPLTQMQVLAGKGLACFLACAIVIVSLLAIGAAVFGLRVQNPLYLVMAIVSASLGFVGIMMFLSVLGKTEAAVSGSGWAVLMIFSMFGGGMVPVFAMPQWMQDVGSFSPIKWAVLSMEGAIWRNFSFTEMMLPCGVLIFVGVAFFTAGTMVLKRTRD